jgi:hypothetical protein
MVSVALRGIGASKPSARDVTRVRWLPTLISKGHTSTSSHIERSWQISSSPRRPLHDFIPAHRADNSVQNLTPETSGQQHLQRV